MAGESIISKWMKENAIFMVLLIVVFLLGIVPLGWYYWQSLNDIEAAQASLRKAKIYNHLATSIVETRQGEYEEARQEASIFFSELRDEEEKGNTGFLTNEQREKLKQIFKNRDEIITMLAQRDQVSLERLTDIYNIYVETVGKTMNEKSISYFFNGPKFTVQKTF